MQPWGSKCACAAPQSLSSPPAAPPSRPPKQRLPRRPGRDASTHTERFVEANGVRLNVLDWGGAGPGSWS